MDLETKKQAEAAFDKWAQEIEGVEEATLTAPLHVVLGEAIEVATMLEHHWQAQVDRNGQTVPGLSAIAAARTVDIALGGQIREISQAVAVAHTKYLILIQASRAAPMERADYVLSELRAVLQFAFDDDKHDDADVQLERLQQTFANSASQDAMALALEGYAALADRHRELISRIETFRVELIEEAWALARQLRDHSALVQTGASPDKQRQALALRNRLVALVQDRVALIRRSARYVFRDHPEVARKFTSAYERRTRNARRLAAEQDAPSETQQ